MQKNFTLIFSFIFCSSLQAIFNCESYDSTIALTDANSQLTINASTNAIDGTLQLRDSSTGLLTGAGNFAFSQGNLITNSTTLSGGRSNLALRTVDVATTTNDTLSLNSTDILAATTAQAPARKVEISASTTPRILGSPIFDQDIFFLGTSATLDIGISNRLNKNIRTSTITSTNTVRLLQDLSLEDGVLGFVPQGTALINLNGYRYEFGFLDSNNYNESIYTPLDMTYGTTNLQFSNPGTFGGISLRSNFRTRIGMRGFGRIYGNGNMFDFSQPAPGTFSFLDLVDGDITLENVHMVGLQLFKNTSASARNIILMDNVTIEISQYEPKQTGGAAITTTVRYGNTSTGSINLIVRGNNCKIITGASSLEFANTTTGSNPCNIIIENGKTLIYDTLSYPDTNNLRVTGAGTITFGVGSRLQHVASQASAPTDYSISVNAANCPKFYLGQSKQLSNSTKITITNSTPGTPIAMTFDGANNTINFPAQASNYFSIDTNVQLTMQNVVLDNFNPAAISFGATSSTLTFGENVYIKMGKDINLATTGRALSFNGTSIIAGHDYTLTVSGDDMLTLGGTSKTLTLKNLRLKLQGTESLSCSTTTAKIVLDNCKLEVGADGWGFKTGNIDVNNQTTISGINKSFYNFGTTTLANNNNHLTGSATFLKAIRRLGFETNYALAYTELSGNGKICLQEASTFNSSTFRAASINNAQNLEYKSSATGGASSVTGPFKSIGMGMDNKIWLVKTDRTIQRLDTPSTLVAAPSLGDLVAVGSATQVYMADTTTGIVYKNSDPTAGSPGSWTIVSGVFAPRSICAVSDGTLYFIDSKGRCLRLNGSNIELVHDGAGYDFQRVSASGNKDTNFVALLSTLTDGGRVLIAQDNAPFFDLGISQAKDVAIGVYGSIVCKFSNIVVPQHTSSGQPTLWRTNAQNQIPLLLDQSMTFSSTGNLAIQTLSTLEIANGANLRYQADPSTNGSNTAATKRHITFADLGSELKLNNASLTSTTTALAMDYGKFTIVGNCNVFSSNKTNNNFEWGSAVDAQIMQNANMNIYGPVEIMSTNAP